MIMWSDLVHRFVSAVIIVQLAQTVRKVGLLRQEDAVYKRASEHHIKMESRYLAICERSES